MEKDLNFCEKILRSHKFIQQLLIEESGQKPDRRVVQPYDPFYIETGMTVIPGADAPFFQKYAAQILCQENPTRIDAAPHPDALFPEQPGNGREQKGHPVNGKHPDGGMPHQFQLPPLQGLQAGPENFQTPAQKSAKNKSFFHHIYSMYNPERENT